MTFLTATPRPAQETDRQVIALRAVVHRDDWFGTYTHLEVWRALDGGPYAPLTGSEYLPALVPPGSDPPSENALSGPTRNLDGTTLKVLVAGRQEVTITFESAGEPMTLAEAAEQVVEQGQNAVGAYLTDDADFVLASASYGAGALLEVVGGTALAELALSLLSPENIGQGVDVRIPLVEGVEAYTFTDPWGTPGSYYRTRLRNSLTGVVSEFSDPIPASTPQVLGPTHMVQGYVAVVDLAGRALVNYAVQVYAEFDGSVVDNRVVAAGDLVQKTDERGRAYFDLVRGQRVTVALPGTQLRRTLTLTTDQNVQLVNLLAGTAGPEDVFRVAVPDIVVAERRSF